MEETAGFQKRINPVSLISWLISLRLVLPSPAVSPSTTRKPKEGMHMVTSLPAGKTKGGGGETETHQMFITQRNELNEDFYEELLKRKATRGHGEHQSHTQKGEKGETAHPPQLSVVTQLLTAPPVCTSGPSSENSCTGGSFVQHLPVFCNGLGVSPHTDEKSPFLLPSNC